MVDDTKSRFGTPLMNNKTEQALEDLEWRFIQQGKLLHDLKQAWDSDKGLAFLKQLEERVIELERKFDLVIRAAEAASAGENWYWEYG